MEVVRGYFRSAVRYAHEKGVRLRLSDGERAFDLVWDARGLGEAPRPATPPDGEADDGGPADEEPLHLDLSIVRAALGALRSDPIGALRAYVPREIIDEAAYTTAVVALECARPRGRLLLFGGPHRFFNGAWPGDACVVFLDERGRTEVYEMPSVPLEVGAHGGTVGLRGEDCSVSLRFAPVRARRDRHGLGRYFGNERLVEALPGLEVRRAMLRFAGGEATLGSRRIEPVRGWAFIERGEGQLLHWPLGATWHYASWLMPDGACGSMVHAAAMLGASTPVWWQEFLERTTDGAHALRPDADAPDTEEYRIALEPGPPARLVGDCALADGRELRYRILSAAVAPFDVDGQVIFRLRCLCGEGAGLVEIPASVPSLRDGARACTVAFEGRVASIRVEGAEVFSVQTHGSTFLRIHRPRRSLLARLFAPLAARR
jgi:hypothetical protein